MQQQHRWTLPLLVVAVSVVVGVHAKDHDELGPYRLITTVLIPGFGNVADRGNTTVTPVIPPRIDVIDTRRLKLLAPLTEHAAGNGLCETYLCGTPAQPISLFAEQRSDDGRGVRSE
jgi:hypothetical protein